MHKKPPLIVYFLNCLKKVLVYPSNIATLFLMFKHYYMPYSVAIKFKGMSSYYDHVYKIEELNYGREVLCMFLVVVHLAYDIM
jgi:hypothetical protein